MAMTPAEMKTIRESVWLSADAFGNCLSRTVTDRTVRRWEAGSIPIPDDAAEELLALDRGVEEAVAAELHKYRRATPDSNNAVVLVRYRNDDDLYRYRPEIRARGVPVAVHAATVDRVRIALARLGIAVRVVFMEPEKYEEWREGERAEDSESTRAAWGASTL